MEDDQTTPEELFDALEVLQSPEFVAALEDANTVLERNGEDYEKMDELIAAYEHEFIELLGRECESTQARAAGFFMLADEDEIPTGEVDYLTFDEIQFERLTVIPVGDHFRIVALFETPRSMDESGEVVEERVYYAEPSSLVTFELAKDDGIPSHELMWGEAKAVRDVLMTPHFMDLSYFEQVDELEALGKQFLEYTSQISPVGSTYMVEADRFMVAFEGMPLGLADCVTDQSDLETHQKFSPSGVYKGVIFPELKEGQGPFRSISDFNLSSGSLCMVLENAESGATFYVPVSELSQLTIQGYYSGDESDE